MSILHDIENQIKSRRRQLDLRVAEFTVLEHHNRKLTEEVKALKQNLLLYDKAVEFLNSISEERQEKAQRQIESLVTHGLRDIFNDSYSFHVKQTVSGEKSKRPEIDFIIKSVEAGRVLETPAFGPRGGGISAVVGLLLMIIVLLLKDSGQNKDILISLDEALAHLSAAHIESLGKFLRKLVDSTSIQIIMVTHQPEYAQYADKIYGLKLVDGYSVAKELKYSDL